MVTAIATTASPPAQAIAWLPSPATMLTRQCIDWDITSLFPLLPPMQSPAEIVIPVSSSRVRTKMPPLSLEQMNDDINASLEMPQTPATPAHLKKREEDCQGHDHHRVELLPPTDGVAIRMRIIRCDANSTEAREDNMEE
ncbi:hypothetical protein QAD02_021069 [Eretmocerus hayati]|uniref:Uncharacterized protein n=1 Tax=Eretmocerus hayati TaxID=131215 RepID=A0ACC2PQJ6_9HYME|nr:hypothetical protein QAD02_021069 [Eretmocerus hayati]